MSTHSFIQSDTHPVIRSSNLPIHPTIYHIHPIHPSIHKPISLPIHQRFLSGLLESDNIYRHLTCANEMLAMDIRLSIEGIFFLGSSWSDTSVLGGASTVVLLRGVCRISSTASSALPANEHTSAVCRNMFDQRLGALQIWNFLNLFASATAIDLAIIRF